MEYPDRGSKKIFRNSGLAPIDFSCPKTPEYQKSANFEKKFFEIRPQSAPPLMHVDFENSSIYRQCQATFWTSILNEFCRTQFGLSKNLWQIFGISLFFEILIFLNFFL